jgi:hypothetical protein
VQKYKNVFILEVFSKCALRESNSRPRGQKECKRFARPSNPPTIAAAFQDATSLKLKAPILNLDTIIVKLGLKLLTPAVDLVEDITSST